MKAELIFEVKYVSHLGASHLAVVRTTVIYGDDGGKQYIDETTVALVDADETLNFIEFLRSGGMLELARELKRVI